MRKKGPRTPIGETLDRRGTLATFPPAASLAAAALFGSAPTASAQDGIYSFTVTTADGGKASLSKYKGKVLLIVNVASACGFTPQYSGLAALADKYANDLVVIAQPCNQFGGQEPGTDRDIAAFAKDKGLKRGLVLTKADVNGSNQTDLYAFLKSKKGGIMGNDIKWNFSKFLVDKQGNVVARYPSTTTPDDIAKDVAKYV